MNTIEMPRPEATVEPRTAPVQALYPSLATVRAERARISAVCARQREEALRMREDARERSLRARLETLQAIRISREYRMRLDPPVPSREAPG